VQVALCLAQCIATCPEEPIRTMAAVLLRQIIAVRTQWFEMPAGHQSGVQSALLSWYVAGLDCAPKPGRGLFVSVA
jgi:hypothetical protein